MKSAQIPLLDVNPHGLLSKLLLSLRMYLLELFHYPLNHKLLGARLA